MPVPTKFKPGNRVDIEAARIYTQHGITGGAGNVPTKNGSRLIKLATFCGYQETGDGWVGVVEVQIIDPGAAATIHVARIPIDQIKPLPIKVPNPPFKQLFLGRSRINRLFRAKLLAPLKGY
jgi:hypothetical protein